MCHYLVQWAVQADRPVDSIIPARTEASSRVLNIDHNPRGGGTRSGSDSIELPD